MTVLAMVVALTAAASVGYLFGRRAGSRRPTWKQRTRRTALGLQAVSLIMLMTASHVQRSAHRRLPSIVRRLSFLPYIRRH
jgi:hypothetical protein